MERSPNESNSQSFLRAVEKLLEHDFSNADIAAFYERVILDTVPEFTFWASSAIDESLIIEFMDSMEMPEDRQPSHVIRHFAPRFFAFYKERLRTGAT